MVYRDGYCTDLCDPLQSGECGPGGLCVAVDPSDASFGFCLAGCEDDAACREGYACTPTAAGSACVPISNVGGL